MKDTSKDNRSPESVKFEMAFGHCLVEGDSETMSIARRSRRKSFGVSLAIEILLLGLLVVTPLLSSVARPKLHLAPPAALAFFGEWHQRNPLQHAAPVVNSNRPAVLDPFQPPVLGSTTRPLSPEGPDVEPAPNLPDGYLPGIVQSVEPAMPPRVEPPPIARPTQPEKRPVKLSEGVLAAQLIARIEPQYPPLARQTRVEGTVRLHAIISRDGNITSLEVISGHPLLVKAALDAVRQWRYRPTMLNGEPTEVETFITVVFQLHG
jgi:TonB family protein